MSDSRGQLPALWGVRDPVRGRVWRGVVCVCVWDGVSGSHSDLGLMFPTGRKGSGHHRPDLSIGVCVAAAGGRVVEEGVSATVLTVCCGHSDALAAVYACLSWFEPLFIPLNPREAISIFSSVYL